MSSNKKKVPSNFKEWQKLTAQLEEKFAAMEIQHNLKEHYNTVGSQLLTEEQEKEKKNIPSELDRLEKEIPALQEKIIEVENSIKGKKDFSLFKKSDKTLLKKAKEKKYPAKKKAVEKKKEEIRMIDLEKKGKKEPPYASLPPVSGLGLALQEKLRFKGKPKSTTLTGPPYSYKGQEELQEYASVPFPIDTRHQPPMIEYEYSSDEEISDDWPPKKTSLGGKRRKKKSRRRRTKKKKRRRKKKTRKKRKKRKRRRRTKKN